MSAFCVGTARAVSARRAVHRESGRTVAARVEIAGTFAARLRGWIGRRPARGEALWLPRCASVHTCGVGAALDLIWCGDSGVVLRVDRALRPWRAAGVRGAAGVCELAAGGAADVAPGDHVDLTPCGEADER